MPPTIAANFPALILSRPNSGPIVLNSKTSISAGNAPLLSRIASLLLSSTEKFPDMIPDPPGMWLRIVGAEITTSSKTIANGEPILSLV